MVYPADAFDSRPRGDLVPIGSSLTKSQKKKKGHGKVLISAERRGLLKVTENRTGVSRNYGHGRCHASKVAYVTDTGTSTIDRCHGYSQILNDYHSNVGTFVAAILVT